jgi:hypothetical protein
MGDKLNAAHEQRRVRKALGLPDPGTYAAPKRSPLERRIIASAAVETAEFMQGQLETIERDAEKLPVDMSTSELALDNTVQALRVVNKVLRKYNAMNADDMDVKQDRLAVDAANQTMRTLARVHEAYLRGQNTDRLGQILSEIRKMDGEK